MKQSFERILITAALPYANGYLHLGHLAGAYLPADIYARYQRLKKRDVLFLCGSDEHGVAITVSAEKEKSTPQAIIDRYHPANKSAFEAFEMSFDNYSRTSIPLHHETTKEFFREFHSREIVVAKKELQLYCDKDKMFLADRYVEGTCPKCKSTQARGDQCENCGTWLNQTDLIDPKCKLCGTTPVVRETTHWYFPLGRYQDRLMAYIDERNKRDGWKDNVLRYCESWFKDGLQDRAVTRDLSWGVQVPVAGYEDKVIYVWFDAVLGYISSAKEWAIAKNKPDAWKEFWQKESTKYVAFIGKDNVVFHCIVFPAMLLAWNDAHTEHYVLPENVPANEFLNFEGQKFSKSRGWGIDVQDFLKYFPADMLRYALAVNLPETRDSDFYLKDFQARVNNELADIVGNFVNRTVAFIDKNFDGKVPLMGKRTAPDEEMIEILKQTPVKTGELFEQYRFREGLMEVMNLARSANKYFNDHEPWKTLKSNPERCATTLHIAIQTVRSLSILLEPVTPEFSANIWKLLNLSSTTDEREWDSATQLVLREGHQLQKPEILIHKIDDKQIDEIVKFLEGGEQIPASVPLAPLKPTITIDDFKKIDLRVARVIEAVKVPKSEKLIKLQIEFGNERRQVVAGIAKHYTPEELVGKTIVVVANLQPAKLMGLESQGMILAASDESGHLTLVGLQSEIMTGSTVK
ncbi:MAG: methionine--tRNA ligase [Ignavibacteriae bacterium]|nr:MAG: methionine--tRNA ligase [Ignavibacteriota bacterium]